MGELFIGLTNNSILLFSIGLIYILIPFRDSKRTLIYKIIIGILTGIVGLIIMSTPFQVGEGIVLDTRSVLISMSGLFFGAIPTLIAIIFTSTHRLLQGGIGAYTGVLVIVISALAGLYTRGKYLKKLDDKPELRVLGLILFGISVHLLMLLSFLTLGELGTNLIKTSGISIMLINPFTGLILGLILFKQRDVDKVYVQLEHISTHDYLTGLYNRGYFENHLLDIDKKENLPISLIIGDVNGLKLVNDSFGHKSGDALLIHISNILNESFPNSVVSRWGGDEFVIVFPHTNENKVAKKCAKLLSTLKESSNVKIPPSISLGHATKTKQSQNIEETLSIAEEMMYRTKLQEGKSVRNTLINTLENTLLEKSHETETHAQNMSKWGMLLAKELECDASTIDEISLLARLHDIGKIGIPDKILLKQKKLNSSEWVQIRKHPEIGYRILNSVHELSHIAEDVLYHHEKWDGTGYPKGLKGTEIPINSRIISIVDTFEVIINGRPYREPRTMTEAIAEIKRCSGTQFDPVIAGVFCKLVKERFL